MITEKLAAQALSCLITVNTDTVVSSSMCSQTDVNLDANPSGGTGPYSFQWFATPVGNGNFDMPNSQNTTFSANLIVLTSVATIKVIVTDALGATDSSTILMTLKAAANLGTVPPQNDFTVCPGSQLSLFGDTGPLDTIRWSKGALTWTRLDSLTIFPIGYHEGDQYTVVSINHTTGCRRNKIITVHVDSLKAHSKNDTTICTATQICLGGSPSTSQDGVGGSSYTWTSSPNLGAMAGINPCVTPAVSADVYLKVTDSKGCKAYDTTHITLNALPVPNAGPDTTVCAQIPVTLHVEGGGLGGTYSWSENPNNNTLAGQETLQNPVVSPTITTVYTVTVTNATGCSVTDNATITVNALPIFPPLTDVAICIPASTTLTSGGGTSYLWSTTATTVSITVSPVITTTYTVTITNGATCTTTDNAVVTVNDVPTASLGSDQQICSGESATLTATATGGPTYLYSWSSNPVGGPYTATASITVSPLINTAYTVTISNSCGTATDLANVIVGALPPVNVGNDTSVCRGTSAHLNGSGGGIYLWSATPADGSLAGHTTEQNPTVTPFNTTTYTLTVTAANGCTASDAVIVFVDTLPLSPTVTGNPNPICEGNTTTLNVATNNPGPFTVVWSSNPSGFTSIVFNPTATPIVTTTYIATVTTACGTNSDSVVVTVHAKPLVSAGADVHTCKGNTTQLQASGSSSYVWLPNNGTLTSLVIANPIASPTITTTYTVTGTDAFGCTNTDQVIVFIDTAFADAGADQNICVGLSATLTATGNPAPITAYLWTPGNLNTASITVSPIITTVYIVTITTTCGTSSDQVTVNVVNNPVAGIASTSPICNGTNIILSGSGGASYNWASNPVDSTLAGQTTLQNPSVTPAVTTTYYLTVTDVCGTDSASFVVTVNDLPTVNAGGDQAKCLNDCADITATPTGGGVPVFTWSSNPVGFNSTDASIHVCPTITTIYTVTVTTACGTATDDVVITVNSLPDISVGADRTICINTCTQLAAVGAGLGGSYLWNTPWSFDTLTVCPLIATTYSVTGTDVNGCSNTDQLIISVDPPNANAGSDTSICFGSSAHLQASGGSLYNWSTTQPGSLNSTSISNPIATPTVTATYIVLITSVNGCTDVDTMVVNVVKPSIDAGVDQIICSGNSVTLNTSVVGGIPYTYSWLPTNLVTSTSANPIASPAISTTYIVNMTSLCGNAEDTVIVLVSNVPVVGISPDSTICKGSCIDITATGGGTYLWSNASTLATTNVCPLATTTYIVTVTSGCGVATNDVLITVNDVPTVIPSIDNDTICNGSSINLSALVSGGGTITYSWAANGVPFSVSATPTANPIINTNYTVTVTNNCGTASDHVSVVVYTTNANAGLDQVICDGTSATIIATGGGSYNWNNGGGINDSLFISPNVSITYTVTVTNNGCTDSDDVAITVNPSPIASISSSTNPSGCGVCDGTGVGLTAGGTLPYLVIGWSDSEFGLNATQLCGGVNTFGVIDANNCTASASVSLTDQGATPIVLSSDIGPAICANDIVNFTTTAGFDSVKFYIDGILVQAGITNTFTTMITNGQTVSASGLLLGCFSASNSITFVVSPTPVANAGLDYTMCAGDSYTFAATGGPTYAWTSIPASVIPAIFDPTVSPGVTTTYILAVTTGCGTARDTAIVHVNPIPVVTISPEITICDGASTTLTATGGPTYDWFPTGETTPSIIVTPLINSTYVVTVTQGGCSASQDVAVNVNSITKYNVTGGGSLCIYGAGTSVNLSNSTLGVSYQLENNSLGPIGAAQVGTGAALVWNNINLAGVYTIVGTNGTSCSDAMNGSATVTVFPATPANAGNDTAICSGMSATLHASGGSSYVWDDASINPIRVVSPVTTTTYHITVTDANACTGMDSVVVTVNSLSVIVTNDTTICRGSSVQLSAAGGSSYIWNPNNATLTNINISNPIATPIVSTTYIVTVSDASGCSGIADVAVNLNTVNKYNITGGGAFCQGGVGVPIRLSGSQLNVNYTLLLNGGNAGFPDITGTGLSITFGNITVSGTYTISAINSITGCTEVMNGNVIVTENPLPTPDAGQDQTICRFSTVTLTGTGGPTYQWSTGEQTATIMDDPIVETTYVLTVTNAFNCTATDEVIVHVSFPPVNAGTDTTKCFNDTIRLNGTGGVSYTWSPNFNISDIHTAIPNVWTTVTTTYTLTATGADGCTAADEIVVTVNNPHLAIIPPDATICRGSSVTLMATANNIHSYLWSTGDTVASISVTPNVTTTYCITVTTGCGTVSNCAVVTVSTDPAAGVNPTNATICVGENIQLQAFGGDTFTWASVPSSGIIPSISNPIVNPVANTVYFVTVTSSCGSAVNSISVNVNTIPTANAGLDLSLCHGHTVPLSVSVTGGGNPTYSWSSTPPDPSLNGQENLPNPTITLWTSADYIVVVDNGCGVAIDTVHLTANNVVALISPPAPVICANGSVTLTAAGADTYSWDYNNQTTTSITVSPAVTTTYSVTATLASCGCTDDAIVIVTVAPSPTATIVSSINPTSCGASDGSAQVAGAGGSGSYTYNWSDGQSLETANNLSGGVWLATVTDLNGCSDVAQAILTDSGATAVTLSANPGITICQNGLVTITANPPGFALYEFYRSSTGLVQTSDSNTYSSTTFANGETIWVVAHASGCSSTSIIGPFIIGSLPVADAGNDQSVCSGIPVNLCASPNNVTGYNWSNGAGNTQCVTVLPIGTTVYTVTVSNACGMDQDSVAINVTQTPTVSANDVIICNESSTVLVANTTNSTSLIWSSSTGILPVPPTSISPVVNPNTNTTYTLTAFNGTCSSTADAVVDVNSIQLCTVSGGGSFCEDAGSATIILNCSEVGVSYQLVKGTSSILAPVSGTGGPLPFTVSTPGTYIIIGTSMITSCRDTMLASATVTMDPKPSLFAGSDTILCYANSVQITTANASIYLPGTIHWSSLDGSFDHQDIINPIFTPSVNSGVVQLVMSVTGLNSCSTYPFSDTMLLVVNPVPPITAGSDTSICSNNMATLHVWGGAASSDYHWSYGNTLSDSTVYNPVADPVASTTYTVTVTTIQGCTASDNVVVSVKPVPTPTITVVGDTVACNGMPVNVTFITNTGFANYQWINNGAVISGANMVSYIANQAGVFSVHVVSPYGCAAGSSSISTYARLPYSPVIHSGRPTTFCDGDYTYLIPDQSYYTYVWASGSTTDSILVMETGAYNVTVTDFYGCEGISNTINITVDPLPSATFSFSDSLLTVDFFDLSINGSSWLWNFGDGSTSTDENPTHFYESPGTYSVKLVVSNSCGIDSLSTQITVVKNTGINTNGHLSRMIVYPNPSQGKINLNLDLNNSSNLDIKISDALGNIIWTDKIVNAVGHIVEKIDLSTNSKGIYLLTLRVDKTVYVKKIILD